MNTAQWLDTFDQLSSTREFAREVISQLGGYRKNAHLGKYTDDISNLAQAFNAMIIAGRRSLRLEQESNQAVPTTSTPGA